MAIFRDICWNIYGCNNKVTDFLKNNMEEDIDKQDWWWVDFGTTGDVKVNSLYYYFFYVYAWNFS